MLSENQLEKLSGGIYKVILVNEHRAKLKLVKPIADKPPDDLSSPKPLKELDISPNAQLEVITD